MEVRVWTCMTRYFLTLTRPRGTRLDVISSCHCGGTYSPSHDRVWSGGIVLTLTSQVLEAMRTRIIELEDELSQQPPTKRARTSNTNDAPDASPAVAGPSNSSSKADEKKRKMQVKKIFDRCEFHSTFILLNLLTSPRPKSEEGMQIRCCQVPRRSQDYQN